MNFLLELVKCFFIGIITLVLLLVVEKYIGIAGTFFMNVLLLGYAVLDLFRKFKKMMTRE